jgi:glutathione S-transferase
MIKLFWHPKTRAQRIVWLMEEVCLKYDRVLIDIRNSSKPRDPEFAEASPMGKVPALADGDIKLSDSAAIAMYIADKYPQTDLAPGVRDAKRAPYLYWMVFTPGAIEPAIGEKFYGWPPNKLQNGWGDFDTMIKTFEGGLREGPWLLGEKFSAADVMCGSSAAFMKQIGILPESQALTDYAARCEARPAYRRSLEIDASGG